MANNWISTTLAQGSIRDSFVIETIKKLHNIQVICGDYLIESREQNGDWNLEIKGEINLKNFHEKCDEIAEEAHSIIISTKIYCVQDIEVKMVNDGEYSQDFQTDAVIICDKWENGKRTTHPDAVQDDS